MEAIIRRDGRYPVEAYQFLGEALEHAVKSIHGEKGARSGRESHVSGQQLCLAIRDLAIQRWGLLARTVLSKWNLRATIDFGNMVYLMIEHEFMRKTETDSIEDFRDVYDFDQAFELVADFDLRE